MRNLVTVVLVLGLAACGGGGGGTDGGTGGGAAGGGAGGGAAGGGAGGGAAGGGAGGGAAGGGAGGGAAGGGAGGGAAGGGAGGGAGASLVTFDAIDFDDARLVVDGAGVTHAAFTAFSFGTAPQAQVLYGRCASNCATLGSWTFHAVDTYGSFGGSTQLVVGPSNSLHLLYTRQSTNSSAIVYARCTQADCTAGTPWSKVDLPYTAGYLVPYDSRVLAVDSNGVPAFVYTSSGTPTNVYFVRCSATDCLQAASWQEALVQVGGNKFDLQYQGTTVYMAYLDFESGTGGYATCAGTCFNGSNWSRVEPFYVGRTGNYTDNVALGFSSSGAMHLAFNQGVTGTGVPSNVKANDMKLQYWSCPGTCLTAGNWTGITFNTQQGDHAVDLEMTPGGGVAIATSDISTTQVRYCASGCATTSATWTVTDLDTTAALQAFRPANQSTPCGSTPFAASWYPSRNLALAASSNRLKVLSSPKLLYQCSSGGQFASMGGPGRYSEVSY